MAVINKIKVGTTDYDVNISTRQDTSFEMGTATTPTYITICDGNNVMRNVPVARYSADDGSTYSDVQCVTYTWDATNKILTIQVSTK